MLLPLVDASEFSENSCKQLAIKFTIWGIIRPQQQKNHQRGVYE